MSEWIVYSKDGITEKCTIKSLEYSGSWMGECYITATIKSATPLSFSIGDYLEYRGERFEINYDPSVTKSATSGTYGDGFTYDNVKFNSLSDELTRCDFLDYVPEDNLIHYSSLPNFSFFADTIDKLAERIQVNLDRVYTGEKKWTIEVYPEYVNKTNVNIVVSNMTCWDALALVKSQFNANFVIKNRTITIGTEGIAVDNIFSYGKGNGLVTIERNAETDQKIVTRLRAYGSTRNLPMRYYFNNGGGIVPNNMAVQNLMLPSFPEETLDPYVDSENISELGIREATIFFDGSGEFEEIYPSMEGMTAEDLISAGIQVSATGRLDEVVGAEQITDNGIFEPTEEEPEINIPTFTITLKDVGFDINDHLSAAGSATISMKDGMCGGREFEIVECKKEGNNYILTCNRAEDTSLGLYFPYNDYNIKAGDKFVLLNIEMPDVYIQSASQRLLSAAKEYLAKNDYVRYSYTPKVDNIYMARQHDTATSIGQKSIHDTIKEGDLMLFEDNDLLIEGSVIIDTLSIKEGERIPEYEITLRNDKTVGTIEKIQNQIDSIVSGSTAVGGSGGYNASQIKSLIKTFGSTFFLRKDQPDTAREVITFEKGLNVGEFVSGASGASFFKDLTTGQTIMELDKLYVRMKAFFETLTIVEAQTISGKQIISPAGSVRCTNVEEYDDYYRCYFLNEQDGEKIENKFIVGDQVYSQMFNAKTGTTNKISNRYYWRLVTGVGENYIDLSKTDCDADSDAPMVGDVLNQRGHRYPENSERMNFIETSTVDGFSPSITLFHGVNSWSLDSKAYVQFGVDKTTNKAFMHVYGDMYVGDRNQTAYIRYTQEDGLEICGKLAVGTKLGDKDLQELIDSATPEGYQEFVEQVTKELGSLQSQIDGAIESFFYQYEPSLTNYPASEWIEEGTEEEHLNDTFTNLVDGRSWRWSLDGTYKWVEITDTATTKALALAGKANDTADGKRRVFVVTDEHPTPYPPYDKGDLWSRGSDYPLLICVVPKESGVYAEGDFDYADNNAKLKEEMQTLVTDTKSELNNSIGQAKEAANKYADEGIASAKEDINASIAELEEAKANVTEVYSKSEADGKITEAETRAINAAKTQADAAIALSETTIKAYADGIVDDEEAARIKQAQENLAEAKRYAEEQAEAAKSEIENSYLFQALQDAQSTEIENGLVLTSLIQLRDTQSNIMSGINGLINASKGDKSIATWWGGGMYDLIDYYRWDGSQWVVKSGLTAPSNIPSGLIRMDGTGYLAKGKFWWDNDGKIYADPTALFLSFDVNAEEGTLSATILDIRDKQTEFANMWSLQTDSNGTQYLYSKYPLVSQGGVTMYAGTSGIDVEGIYDGLPIDGSTIYWENGVLKAQGGGVADSVAWADITGKPTFATVATSGSYNDLLNKPTLLSSFTNDVGYLTEHQDLSGYQPLITSSNKLSYSLISGTPTIPTSLKNPYVLSWGGYSSGSYDGSAAKSITIPSNTNQLTNGAGFITSSALSGYLPLSGGTISNETTSPLDIDTTGSECNLQVRVGGVGKVMFGYKTNVGAWMRTSSGYNLVIGEDNVLKYGLNTTLNTILHSSNYSSYALPLTGGTLTGKLTINTSSYGGQLEIYRNQANGNSAIRFSNSEKVLGDIGVCGSGGEYPYQPYFTDRTTNIISKIYHSGNLTKLSQLTNDSGFITSSASITGNAATATKLATARTIWGQSFDGTGNVTGNLTMPNSSYIYWNDSSGATRVSLYLSSDNILRLGLGTSASGYNTVIDGNDILFRVATTHKDCMILNSSGNIGIGTDSPNYKLDVEGTARVGNNVADGVLLKFNMDRAWHFYQEGSGASSTLVLKSEGDGKYFHIKNNAGSNIASFYASTSSGNRVGVNGTFEATTIYQNGSSLDSLLGTKLNSSSYTAADVLAKLKTVDGSGSGLDADLLDGLDSSKFLQDITIDYGTGISSVDEIGTDLQTGISRVHVGNVEYSSVLTGYNYNGRYWQIRCVSGSNNFLWVRTYGVPTWERLAYITDNVASATKLQTPRTIWGQSFDGTGNVSGALSGVTGVTMTGAINQSVGENRFSAGSTFTDPAPNISASTKFSGLIAQTGGNVLLCTTSGNVGIGTTSPSQKLSVKGSIWAEGNGIFNWSPSRCNIYENQIQMFSKSYGGYVIYSGLESGEACRFEVLNSNGGWTSQGWTLFQNGNITMGTTTNYGYKLGVTGSVYITSNLLTGGGITMYSQRSLKNVIDEEGLSLRELSVIKPTRYTWKDKRDERLHIGGIADDIEQVLPEVVYRTPDGVLTMDYGNAAFAIASSLIKPMIEHESEIVSLKRRVRELEEEVKRLRA